MARIVTSKRKATKKPKVAAKAKRPKVTVVTRKVEVPASLRMVDVVDYSKPMDLSVLDWRDRIRNQTSLMPDGLILDRGRAEFARSLFENLCLPDVSGLPLLGDAAGEWIFELVGAVFGSWNGTVRGINEFFELVPKKNSKTTNGAAIMVVALLVNERPRAEFLLVAPTQAIAQLSFNQAVGMIENDEVLRSKFMIKDYIKEIVFIPTGAKLKIKSFDPQVLTGTKPCGVLVDELHVIAAHPNADRVIGQIRGGLISQPEGFLIFITTQSERPPAGVFRQELMKARKVRDGAIKGMKLLARLYEFPEDIVKSGEWKDPKNWPMVLPNAGRSITVPRLMEDWQIAKENGPEEVARWASQHLNIEIGIGLKTDHWVGGTYWLQTSRETTLEEMLEECDAATIGVDGGGLDDMLAIAVCTRHAETKKLTVWSQAWLHEKAVERRKDQRQVYLDLQESGGLSIIAQLGQDIDELGDVAEQVLASRKLFQVGVDPAAIANIVEKMVEIGIAEDAITSIPQGWRLTSAIKTVERKLADGSMDHVEQPLTRFAVENAKVEARGNAILITKQISGSAKIDPLMAIFNAIEIMSRAPARVEKDYQMLFVGGQ